MAIGDPLGPDFSGDRMTGPDLGHVFTDRALLTQALTHSSASKKSNERLEFLGDRVLGLVIAQELIRRYPEAPEGDLAIRLNELVRKETCARMAQKSGIDKFLVLAPGERQGGGARKSTVLGDACEAVIAALFLDGGLEPAARFILANWGDDLATAAATTRDAKSELQSWAQAREELGRPLPAYRVLKRTGADHAPHFVVEALVKGAGTATGEGASKREAERNAAEALLGQLTGREP